MKDKKLKLNGAGAKNLLTTIITSLLFFLMMSMVHADDTEIFFSKTRVNPNVLFVMDNSGSMDEIVEGSADTENPTVVPYTFKINHKKDDAEEPVSGSSRKTITNSSDLGFLFDQPGDQNNSHNVWGANKDEQLLGLRFTEIAIPKNAVVESAYIQFTTDKNAIDNDRTGNELALFNIQIQDHHNPARFNTYVRNIANRALHTNVVSWEVPLWVGTKVQSSDQKTSDLKDLVQHALNATHWQEDNAMVFVFSNGVGSTGVRSAQSFNSDQENAPKLIIKIREMGKDKTRLQVMQGALKKVLGDTESNLSVGIMNYGDTNNDRDDKPNGIRFPISPIDDLAKPIIETSIKIGGVANWGLSNIPKPQNDTNVATFLSEIADSWTSKGATPIVDALYEAALYYRGMDPKFGKGKAKTRHAAHPATYTSQAPNLVEAVGDDIVTDSCGASPSRKIFSSSYDKRYQLRTEFKAWKRGNTGGIKCPADRSNPVGPGSEANCGTYLQSCNKYYTTCKNGRYPKTYEDYDCKIVDGIRKCKRRQTGGGGCKRGGNKRVYYCDTYTCNAKKEAPPMPSYKSPITAECQSNYIVLMSDGEPEYYGSDKPKALSKIKSLMTDVDSCAQDDGTTDVNPNAKVYESGVCGSELTHYLARVDNMPGTKIEGDQKIYTYVIGFAEGIDAKATNYLKSLVSVPETSDGYFSAKNGAQLATAFKNTLAEIAQEARSQASPGYSVNVRSGLEHEDELYIPVFDKSSSSVWSGNLKKFKLVGDTDSKGKEHRYIRGKDTATSTDAGSLNAMDEKGLFTDDAWDFWSNSTKKDGDNVQKGGTASLLTNPDVRNLYSNISGSSVLSATSNKIKVSNTDLKNNMLFDVANSNLNSAGKAAYRAKLIQFIRGWKDGLYDASKAVGSKGTPRKHMGDMLHSEPVIITYNKGDGTAGSKVQYIFAATNEGYLHVFDAITGEEVYAFMPKELLKNIENQFTGKGKHQYGVDGNITFFHDDLNHDGNVNNSEKVYLYFGMRRGGRSYYALDISSKNAPELLWSIDNSTTPASGSINTSEGFSRLGQTWSLPYLANVVHAATKKKAVIFTGGNEAQLDYGNTRAYSKESVLIDRETQSMGDDIYIVDAEDGSKILWSLRAVMGNDVVKHGLAGGVRILDVNGNGFLDRMYFADTGGNVWRLDLSETLSTDAADSKLTKLASLATEGSGESAEYKGRKFYNEPDVARVIENGKVFFTISIGSGLRPHPMNKKIDDYMFVLLDDSPTHKLTTDYETIKMSDLAKVEVGVTATELSNGKVSLTKTLSQDDSFDGKKITDAVDSNDKKRRGWYVDFNKRGEKVLASSTTFEGSILFTTLVPEAVVGDDSGACSVPITQGRVYALNLLTGEPSANLDGEGGIDDQDVFKTISSSEIPGKPQLIFNSLNCENGSCKHDVDVRIGKKSTEVDTKNLSEAESIYWSDPIQ